VSAPQYVHPEFGSFSRKCFRHRGLWIGLTCLTVVIVGAVLITRARVSDAAVAPEGRMSNAETVPTTTLMGYSAVDPPVTVVNGTQVVVDQPFCFGGNCVVFQLPKVRMVRVPRVASVGQQENLAKSGAAAAPRSPGLDKAFAEPKKAQSSTHRQTPRSTQSRREARTADWTARGYTSRDRREDGRQGFARNFW
jgi:hypothetical protein